MLGVRSRSVNFFFCFKLNSEQQYIDLFLQHGALLSAGSHPLIDAHREQALELLSTENLPSRKDERYKYTDVRAILEPDYGLNLSRLQLPYDPRKAYRCRVPGLNSRLHYIAGDSVVANNDVVDEETLFVGSLVEFAKSRPEVFSTYYNKMKGDSLAALNTMLVQDGLVIYAGRGRKVEDLIQVVSLAVGGVPMLANRRQLIILEEGAEVAVLSCNHSATDQENLASEVVEGYLEPNSRLQYYCVEENGSNCRLLNNTYFALRQNSSLEYASIVLKGGTSRRTVNVALNEPQAEVVASGLVVADGEMHTDNNLLVCHNAPQCHSDMLYKYVLDGKSVGAFAGKVFVAQGAQKTDSQQTNANLCVSPEAHMYTQPMLEIYADDVKCNHGSTIGQLDDLSLFYMAQRGIAPDEGRLLLQQAFAWEVISRIALPPLRQRMQHLLEERFRFGAGACGDCTVCGA